jgi:hypothetical protein
LFDALAQRYGTLPSKLLLESDSFDLMVFDVALTYEKLRNDKANNNVDQSMYKQEDLQQIMQETKDKTWQR